MYTQYKTKYTIQIKITHGYTCIILICIAYFVVHDILWISKMTWEQVMRWSYHIVHNIYWILDSPRWLASTILDTWHFFYWLLWLYVWPSLTKKPIIGQQNLMQWWHSFLTNQTTNFFDESLLEKKSQNADWGKRLSF